MGRKFLMVLLGVGAVAGFASGFARMCHGGFGHYGTGGRFDHHSDFERRVADTCTDSALKVYQRQNPPGSKP
jgi:hypothetical protein